MSRTEFSVSVRKAAAARAGDYCECGCGQKFTDTGKGRRNYDHDVPAYLGGKATLDNCKVLRFECHVLKTRERDTQHIVKARRGEKKRMGFEKTKRKIPGSKGTGLRKKLDGTVVRVQE